MNLPQDSTRVFPENQQGRPCQPLSTTVQAERDSSLPGGVKIQHRSPGSLVLGQRTVALAPRVHPETAATAEHSVQQRLLALAPVVVDLATEVVERLGDLRDLLGGGHLAETETLHVAGQDLTCRTEGKAGQLRFRDSFSF